LGGVLAGPKINQLAGYKMHQTIKLLFFLCLLLMPVIGHAQEILSSEAEHIATNTVNGDVQYVGEAYNVKGEKIYEFVIEKYNQDLVKVEVNAQTGKVVEVSDLQNYQDEKKRRMQEAEKKAIKIVEDHVPGGFKARLRDSEYKHVGGKLIYEFEIEIRTRAYEVRIDGKTGELISMREEN
jgi:uncharacterized membrane protein YkoI